VKIMTHFPLDPPRINKEDRKQRSSYCHECLERFTAGDVRCSYGNRFFHKECYKRWQEKRIFQCVSSLNSGQYDRSGRNKLPSFDLKKFDPY
jgi:hypothetical protein